MLRRLIQTLKRTSQSLRSMSRNSAWSNWEAALPTKQVDPHITLLFRVLGKRT